MPMTHARCPPVNGRLSTSTPATLRSSRYTSFGQRSAGQSVVASRTASHTATPPSSVNAPAASIASGSIATTLHNTLEPRGASHCRPCRPRPDD